MLHVATVVYETGGHGRVLERWLERDGARTPTVLLLKEDEPVPASLTRAVAAAGGSFAPSLGGAGDLFARARALRALAAAHDLVVLHVSNHEVVVPLAFADPVGRPPTILCNHASHQLWTGVGCADVVANLNDFDAAVQRRAPRRRARAQPRAAPAGRAAHAALARRGAAGLGLDPDAPVVLTIASPYKLRAVLEPSYGDLAAAVLDAVPGATLLLVGPGPDDAVALPGDPRVRALGPLPDVAPQLAAADLLLDSWPVTGGTTALDAGAAGLPVLALGDPPPEMVGAPPDLLGGAVARAASVGRVGGAGRRAAGRPGRARRLAARAAAVVAERHGEGWARRDGGARRRGPRARGRSGAARSNARRAPSAPGRSTRPPTPRRPPTARATGRPSSTSCATATSRAARPSTPTRGTCPSCRRRAGRARAPRSSSGSAGCGPPRRPCPAGPERPRPLRQSHLELVASVKRLTELTTLAESAAIAAICVAEGLDGSASTALLS